MKPTITPQEIPDVLLIEPHVFPDERGFFMEPWNKRSFKDAGFTQKFVQEGHSKSQVGTLRGLHYQDMAAPMGKLVRCTVGKIFDVAVDLRANSQTFGKYVNIELSADNKKQLYVPVGFAHGFIALTEGAEVQYKQTGFYTPSSEGAIIWNDPDLKIDWPITNPVLSEKDKIAMTFSEYKKNPAFQK